MNPWVTEYPHKKDEMMKTNTKTRIACLSLVAGMAFHVNAATITTFSELDSATPTTSVGGVDTSASGFTQPNASQDVTFDFILDTAATFSDIHLFDFGGGNGASMRLESNRIVFRSYTGTDMLYVASNEISASTSYRVTGSIFMNGAGDDEMRLYLDEADAVDTGFSSWQPIAEVGSSWRGGNGAGYGVVGSSDYLIGTPGSPGNTGFSPTDAGVLGSSLDIYENTYLAAIPEPSSIALLGLAGLAALFIRGRR